MGRARAAEAVRRANEEPGERELRLARKRACEAVRRAERRAREDAAVVTYRASGALEWEQATTYEAQQATTYKADGEASTRVVPRLT